MALLSSVPITSDEENPPSIEQPTQEPELVNSLNSFEHDEQQFIKGYN